MSRYSAKKNLYQNKQVWDTHNHHRAAHTVSAVLLDRNIKTIHVPWDWSGLCCKTLPRGYAQPVPLDIFLQNVWWGPGGRGTISRHPKKQREVWEMGGCNQWHRSPWEFSFSHCAGQISNLSLSNTCVLGDTQQPITPTPPSLSFACTVGPQGTHKSFNNAFIVGEFQVVY